MAISNLKIISRQLLSQTHLPGARVFGVQVAKQVVLVYENIKLMLISFSIVIPGFEHLNNS